MTDPELNDEIYRDVSRRSSRDLRRMAAGTTSGHVLVDDIAAGAQSKVSQARARRQLRSYVPWVLVAGLVVGLAVALSPGLRDRLADIGQTGNNPQVAMVEGLGGAGVEVRRHADGNTWLLVYNPPAHINVNGREIKFNTGSGLAWVKLGKANEVTVVRDSKVDRFVWTETGWEKQ